MSTHSGTLILIYPALAEESLSKSNKSLTSNLTMFLGQHNLKFSMPAMLLPLYTVTFLSAMYIQTHGKLEVITA